MRMLTLTEASAAHVALLGNTATRVLARLSLNAMRGGEGDRAIAEIMKSWIEARKAACGRPRPWSFVEFDLAEAERQEEDERGREALRRWANDGGRDGR